MSSNYQEILKYWPTPRAHRLSNIRKRKLEIKWEKKNQRQARNLTDSCYQDSLFIRTGLRHRHNFPLFLRHCGRAIYGTTLTGSVREMWSKGIRSSLMWGEIKRSLQQEITEYDNFFGVTSASPSPRLKFF